MRRFCSLLKRKMASTSGSDVVPVKLRGEGWNPSALRNRGPILEVVDNNFGEALRAGGAKVIFVAEGSGVHSATLASAYPKNRFFATDTWSDSELEVMAARLNYEGVGTACTPARLDTRSDSEAWARIVGGSASVDLAFCINMLHISPWEAAEGLVRFSPLLFLSHRPSLSLSLSLSPSLPLSPLLFL